MVTDCGEVMVTGGELMLICVEVMVTGGGLGDLVTGDWW